MLRLRRLPPIRHSFYTPALAAVLGAHALGAQTDVLTPTPARAAPGGNVVATLLAGGRVSRVGEEGTSVRVRLEGWVVSARLGAPRDSFASSVNGSIALRLRTGPSSRSAVIAEFAPGAGLTVVERRGAWSRVRREVWVSAAALRSRPAAAGQPPARGAVGGGTARGATGGGTARGSAKSSTAGVGGRPAAPAESRAPEPAPPSGARTRSSPAGADTGGPRQRAVVPGGARLRDTPVGRVLGELAPGTVVEPLARQFGWVRVRAEGWVNERELTSPDSAAPATVTIADLRADPEGMRGRAVEWEVQLLSLQTADPLRPDFARDEHYVLARGPGAEQTLLYLAVPPSLLAQVRTLPPLSRVRVSARVRTARSTPVGTPILDLLAITKP